MLPLKASEQKFFIITAAFYGLLTVLLGAFGTHMLQDHLTPEMRHAFNTGIQYQMFHTLLLLILGGMELRFLSPFVIKSGWCFVFGIPLFSGSLYALAITGFRVFAIFTPVGGLLFLMGWAMLFWGLLKNQG